MTAYGYTSGDPRKVDIAGDTMTGPLILSEDPVVPMEAAPKQYVDAGGGGGGGGTPSNTVTTQTTYGAASTAGVATAYSRGDHAHGTPALPTPAAIGADPAGAAAAAQANAIAAIPGPSGTVVSETAFGQAAAAGVANTTSRGDHTHGTPAAPASGSFKTVVQARLTSGNITAAAGPSFTIVGSDLTIPAATGDILAVDIDALCDAGGIDCQFEACTRVSAANLNFWSSGNTVSLNPGGVATWYVFGGQFNGPRGRAYYTVQAGDIVAGNVTVRMLAFGAGGGRVINANTSYPFKWALSNVGA